jgi:hypothetical protein
MNLLAWHPEGSDSLIGRCLQQLRGPIPPRVRCRHRLHHRPGASICLDASGQQEGLPSRVATMMRRIRVVDGHARDRRHAVGALQQDGHPPRRIGLERQRNEIEQRLHSADQVAAVMDVGRRLLINLGGPIPGFRAGLSALEADTVKCLTRPNPGAHLSGLLSNSNGELEKVTTVDQKKRERILQFLRDNAPTFSKPGSVRATWRTVADKADLLGMTGENRQASWRRPVGCCSTLARKRRAAR